MSCRAAAKIRRSQRASPGMSWVLESVVDVDGAILACVRRSASVSEMDVLLDSLRQHDHNVYGMLDGMRIEQIG